MSRSVTVAVAYIMSTTNLSWKEALKVVRVGRSIANPNVGFQQQLKDFESSRLQDVSHTSVIILLHIFSLRLFFLFLSGRNVKSISLFIFLSLFLIPYVFRKIVVADVTF